MKPRNMQYDQSLQSLYKLEEYMAEKRINKVMLPIIILFDIALLILPLITSTKFTNPNLMSNFTGMTIILIYQIVNYILLKKQRNNWFRKYLTMFFNVSIITIATYGYHYGTDFVHSTRTITISAYFLTIVLSGHYQNPGICLYTALLASLQYTAHFLTAFFTGWPIYAEMESFTENILTWDILYVNLLFFSVAGILMYLNSKGHRQLMNDLRYSNEKLIREKEKADYFKNYDDLTNLPNLKQFKEKVSSQIRIAASRDQSFTLLCLGIDGFIKINQLYSVNAGDTFLKDIGERLKQTYREDDFLCRFNGDKFLVMFPDIKSNEKISHLIKKTRDAFSSSFNHNNEIVRFTVSGGFSSFPNDAATSDRLIENAEAAMYAAKQSGRDSFRLYDRNRQSELEQQIFLEKALQVAAENAEFHLVYQPKVDASKKIIGLESLLRWNHPKLGAVSPEAFIPIAEKSGDIISIGYFVFEECCIQIKKWERMGIKPVPITINVSPFQFLHPGLISNLERIISEYNIDTRWLGIELTESGMMIDESECIAKLSRIKELGLMLSIDDFGKGYSSLSRLGNYPVDTLKIDKSFIDGLPDSATSVCLVKSIIDLAHNLNYQVIAEGVETGEQVDFLLAHGCSRFQGYYFHKPLPAEELDLLLPGPD